VDGSSAGAERDALPALGVEASAIGTSRGSSRDRAEGFHAMILSTSILSTAGACVATLRTAMRTGRVVISAGAEHEALPALGVEASAIGTSRGSSRDVGRGHRCHVRISSRPGERVCGIIVRAALSTGVWACAHRWS
jgi:hypothetical protein